MGRGLKEVVILEKLVSLSLKDLRGLRFFDKHEGYRTMPVTITRRNGLANESYGIGITVSTQSGNAYIKFDFEIDGQAVSYCLPLVQEANHLTKHFTYYFKCGVAGKKCRKLYLYKRRFVCRDAIPASHYLRNTLSKRRRREYENMKRLTKLERDIADCGRKWFQRCRYGKHTINMKRAIRAKAELDRLNKNFL